MTCPTASGMCTTCRLGGLVRCPVLGVPLPLVEGEKPRVEWKHIDSYPSDALLKWRKDQGHFE